MVTLVIPVFNKVELTKRCLASVLAHSKRTDSVVVIDNGSVDETPQLLQDFHSQFVAKKMDFQVIRNEKNLGFGAACNQGIRLANSEYVAVLNNDTWVMPAWDDALIVALNEEKVKVIGPFFDERPWVTDMEKRADLFLAQNRFRFRKHFVPILMFFSQEAIAALRFSHGGIFDELFFVTYEDTDLWFRMKQLRIAYGQTSRCYIWHASMGTRAQAGLLPEGYEAEGLQKFIKKWGFDPRDADHTWIEKIKRRYRKMRAERGMF